MEFLGYKVNIKGTTCLFLSGELTYCMKQAPVVNIYT